MAKTSDYSTLKTQAIKNYIDMYLAQIRAAESAGALDRCTRTELKRIAAGFEQIQGILKDKTL